MLTRNGSSFHANPGRFVGASFIVESRPGWGKLGALRNFYAGEGTGSGAAKQAFPLGYVHPSVWVLAPKAGGMGATLNRIVGAGAIGSANLAGGLNAAASLSGDGDITNAALGLIVSAVASLSGSGALAGDIVGKLEAAAALTGAGDLTAALEGVAAIAAALEGTGSVAAAITAIGSMGADIVVTGDLLSTANVGAAVWAEILELVSGGTEYNAKQIMQAMFAVLAGKVTGAPGSPSFKSPSDGTTERVTSTSDGDGNRSAVTITTG